MSTGMDKPERPTALGPRRGITPAPDEDRDPIDTPAPPAPAATPAPSRPPRPSGRRAERVPAVGLSTRVSQDVSDLIAQVSDEDGLTVRAVVENAIRATYGDRAP